MTEFTKNIPETGWEGAVNKIILKSKTGNPLLHVFSIQTGHAHPGEITFDIGEKHRDTHIRKRLRHHFHGYGFTRAGCTGNQAMAIGHLRPQK